MEEIFEAIQSSSSPQKFQTINEFLATATEDQAKTIFGTEDAWTRAPALLLSLAKKFQEPSLLLQIIEKMDCKTVKKQAIKSTVLYSSQSPLTETGFLLKFLDRVSYSTRLTIINNLGVHIQHESVADKVFEAVSEHYGFFSAVPILPACSYGLISRHITQRRFKLKDRCLLRILKKYPELGVEHLKIRYLKGPWVHPGMYSSCQKYLINFHPAKYLSILQAYCEERTILDGWRIGSGSGLKKLLKASSDPVETLVKYYSILKMNQVRKLVPWEQYRDAATEVVRKHVRTLGLCVVGADTWAVEGPLRPFLYRLPAPKQRELIHHCCESVLKMSLQEATPYLAPNLVSILDPADRNSIAECKISIDERWWELKDLSNEDIKSPYLPLHEPFWYAMKTLDKSVPYLKVQLLKEQSSENRAIVTACLVITCTINRDAEELAKIFPMLIQEAQNGKHKIRCTLMEALNYSVNYLHFSQAHWDSVQKLLLLQQQHKELTLEYKNLYQAFITFCYANDQKPTEIVQLLVSALAGGSDSIYHRLYLLESSWNLPATCKSLTPVQQKSLIDLCIKALDLTFAGDSEDDDDERRRLITAIICKLRSVISQWNRLHGNRHGKIIAHNYQWLMKNTLKLLAWETNTAVEDWANFVASHEVDLLFSIKCVPTRSGRIEKIPSMAQDLFLHKLKCNQSSLLAENLVSKVILTAPCKFTKWGQATKSNFHRFLVVLKHSGFRLLNHKLLSESCKALDENDGEKTPNALKVLLLLAPTTRIEEYVLNFIPTESKIDHATKDKVDYSAKGAICCYLKYLRNSSPVPPLIKRFCVGDYLRMSLVTLYTAVINAPANLALAFLREELNNVSVKYKKHILRLYFTVAPVNERLEVLSSAWMTERDPSVRVQLSSEVLRILAETSSSQAWDLFQLTMKSLTSDEDLECLTKIIHNLQQLVPSKFCTQALSLCLETLKRFKAPEDLLNEFTTEAKEALDHLDDEFCVQLIQKRLEHLREDENRELVEFIVHFIIKSGSGLVCLNSSLINLVENQWKGTKIYNWPSGERVYHIASALLWQLVDRLENKAEESKEIRPVLLKALTEVLESLKTGTTDAWKVFRYELRIQFALALFEFEDEKEENMRAFKFGANVGRTMDDYIKRFGGEVVLLLASVLKDFVRWKFGGLFSEQLCLHVIEGILSDGAKESERNYRSHVIIATRLLPYQTSDQSQRLQKLRDSIVNQIESCTDATVKILYELSP